VRTELERAGLAARLGSAVAAAGVLLACGSGEKAATPLGGAKPAATTAARQPAGPDLSGMVSAVSGAHTGSATAQMKFELRERPSVAQPLDISLVIVPGPGVLERVYGQVEAGDGLALADGMQIGPVEKPVEGQPILHSIKVVPKREGIFTLNATVSLDAGGQTSTQAFYIPLIVGQGATDVPAKPATTVAAGKPAGGTR
jgi:hypothetical protein